MPYTPNNRVPFVGVNTSEAAAGHQESTGKASVDRLRLTEYLRECGPRGSTTDAAEVGLGLLHQTCSARMKDLIDTGVVVRLEDKRPTRTGRMARVQVLVKFCETQGELFS